MDTGAEGRRRPAVNCRCSPWWPTDAAAAAAPSSERPASLLIADDDDQLPDDPAIHPRINSQRVQDSRVAGNMVSARGWGGEGSQGCNGTGRRSKTEPRSHGGGHPIIITTTAATQSDRTSTRAALEPSFSTLVSARPTTSPEIKALINRWWRSAWNPTLLYRRFELQSLKC